MRVCESGADGRGHILMRSDGSAGSIVNVRDVVVCRPGQTGCGCDGWGIERMSTKVPDERRDNRRALCDVPGGRTARNDGGQVACGIMCSVAKKSVQLGDALTPW
jgi:hypothetical protein